MSLILMLITNDPAVAKEADKVGIDRIFLDFEIRGKYERQGHRNTHIAKHNIEDIKKIKGVLTHSKVISRINPFYEKTKEEVEEVIRRGTDIIMLPMFRTVEEVQKFIDFVNRRTNTCLLLETAQAMARIDDILEVAGIDEIHIGLNDLHLDLGLDFMFEPLSSGIVEYLGNKIKKKKIKWGFGGIAQIGGGMLPAEFIIGEHVRLGSEMVILSRTFKTMGIKDLVNEVRKVREKINEIEKWGAGRFEENKKTVKKLVNKIASELREKNKNNQT